MNFFSILTELNPNKVIKNVTNTITSVPALLQKFDAVSKQSEATKANVPMTQPFESPAPQGYKTNIDIAPTQLVADKGTATGNDMLWEFYQDKEKAKRGQSGTDFEINLPRGKEKELLNEFKLLPEEKRKEYENRATSKKQQKDKEYEEWGQHEPYIIEFLKNKYGLKESFNAEIPKEKREEAKKEWESASMTEKTEVFRKIEKEQETDYWKYRMDQQEEAMTLTFYKEMEKIYGKEKAIEIERQANLAEMNGRMVRGTVLNFLRAGSIGLSDVISRELIGSAPESIYRDDKAMTVYFSENKPVVEALENVKAITDTVASFAGGMPVYGAISGKIRGLLAGVPGNIGKAMVNRPVLTAYTVQGVGEELVEMSIRKITGQEYGWNDFMLGMAMNTGFESAFRGARKASEVYQAYKANHVKIGEDVENSLIKAEQAKGARLTQVEIAKAVYQTPINDQFNLGDLYKEVRLAHKTGLVGSAGERGMTSLKSQNIKPSVTDIGVKISAEPEGVRSQGIDDSLIAEAKKYDTAEEFVKAQGNKSPEYAMSHRPTFDGSPPAHNLLEGDMLPKDVYTHPEWSIASGRNIKTDISAKESFEILKKIKDNPEMEVTVYRASPKNELNIGDWVTFSKNYAEGEGAYEGSKVFAHKVKAKDIYFAGDDINEFGYFPKSQLTDIWKQAHGESSGTDSGVIRKTGANELPDAGKISEQAAMKAEIENDRMPWETEAEWKERTGETKEPDYTEYFKDEYAEGKQDGETLEQFTKRRVKELEAEEVRAMADETEMYSNPDLDASELKDVAKTADILIDAFSQKGAKFYLTGGKTYKGEVEGKRVEIKGSKKFASTFSKMFIEGDIDTFRKSVIVLEQQYRGTALGQRLAEIRKKIPAGLLDDPEIFDTLILPKLEKYAANRYRRTPDNAFGKTNGSDRAGANGKGKKDSVDVPSSGTKNRRIRELSREDLLKVYDTAPKTIKQDIDEFDRGVQLSVQRFSLLQDYLARKGLGMFEGRIVRDSEARARRIAEKKGLPTMEQMIKKADRGFTMKPEQRKAVADIMAKRISPTDQGKPDTLQGESQGLQAPKEGGQPNAVSGKVGRSELVASDKGTSKKGEIELDTRLPKEVFNSQVSKVYQPVKQSRKLNDEMALALFNDLDQFKDLNAWESKPFTTKAPIRAAEAMDGKRFGTWKKNFLFPIQDADKAYQKELRLKQAERDELFKGLNRKQREAVFGYAEQKMTDVDRAELTKNPKIKEVARKLRKNYDDFLDRINKERKAIGKDEVSKRKDYITHYQELGVMQDVLRMFGINMTEVPNSMLTISMMTKPNSPYFKFAKARLSEITARDAKEAYSMYLEPALRTIHFSRAMKNARDILEYRVAMKSEYEGGKIDKMSLVGMKYPNAYSYWTEYLNTVSGKRDMFDKILPSPIVEGVGFMNRLFAPGSIGGNLSTVFTQGASLRNTVAETGVFALKGQALINTPKWYKFFTENSRVGMGRQYEPSVKSQRLMGSKTLAKTHNAISDVISIPVSVLDREMVGGAFLSGYFKGKSLGLKMADAIRYADDVAERTQASANMVDASPINRGKMKKFLGQFQTFVYNEWSQIKDDIVKKTIFGEKTNQKYGEGLFGLIEGRSTGAKRLAGYAIASAALNAVYDELGIPNPIRSEDSESPIFSEYEAVNTVYQFVVNQIPFVSSVRFGGSPAAKGLWNGALYISGSADEKEQAVKSLKGLGFRLFPGGGQISKTWGTIDALADKGKVKSASGKTVKFQIDRKDLYNVAKALAFGVYQSDEGQEYLDELKGKKKPVDLGSLDSLDGLSGLDDLDDLDLSGLDDLDLSGLDDLDLSGLDDLDLSGLDDLKLEGL